MSIYATVHDIDDPIVYDGSHVRPTSNYRRGGNVDVAIIPDHIDVDIDVVRLSVHEEAGGSACVLLTRDQAREIGRALLGEDR